MNSCKMQKPYIVRFHIDCYILVVMYICFFNKIPMDIMLVMYEKFGKHSLFIFKALACKNFIRISDKQFAEILADCTLLDRQIKNKNIVKRDFNEKMQRFINYLESNSENLYDYEIRFFFDLADFYGVK